MRCSETCSGLPVGMSWLAPELHPCLHEHFHGTSQGPLGLLGANTCSQGGKITKALISDHAAVFLHSLRRKLVGSTKCFVIQVLEEADFFDRTPLQDSSTP